MNNKLRIVIKVVISIFIWLGISYFALSKSLIWELPSCPCPEGAFCSCESNPELIGIMGENLVLGSILLFILIPGTLIFLFNKFLLTKKSTKNHQRIQLKIIISIIIWILIAIFSRLEPIGPQLGGCHDIVAPVNTEVDCTNYYLFNTEISETVANQINNLVNYVLFPGIVVVIFNTLFLKKNK